MPARKPPPGEDAPPALNTTAACVLGLLLLGPAPPAARDGAGMSGFELHDTAQRSVARFWNMTRSQIYLELRRLERDGLVEASDAEGPRSRRPYRITDRGRAVFGGWLGRWASRGPRPDQLHSPLVLTVFFGELLEPDLLEPLLREYLLQHQRLLAARRHMLESVPAVDAQRLPTATLRRGIQLHEMTVAWIAETMRTLAGE